MNCHICAEPAIGECQVCWKFYCAEHGDRRCQTCQKERESAVTYGRWDSMGAVTDEPRSSRAPGDSRPPRPDIDKEVLQRVIAVAQKVQLGDTGETEVTLVCLELFESGFIANFRLRGWGPGSNPQDDPDQPNINRAPDYYVEAVDDHGNKYQGRSGGGGGGNAHHRNNHRFTPGLTTADGQLHFTIEEILWTSHRAGVRQMIETGPWQFDVSLE